MMVGMALLAVMKGPVVALIAFWIVELGLFLYSAPYSLKVPYGIFGVVALISFVSGVLCLELFGLSNLCLLSAYDKVVHGEVPEWLKKMCKNR